MNEAFVEDAENDIHDEDRRQDEEELVRERRLECGGRALERRSETLRQAYRAFGRRHGRHGVPERCAWREIERDRCRRKLREMTDLKRLMADGYARDSA